MGANLAGRIPPGQAARARELDERAMPGRHFESKTLQRHLTSVTVPTVVLLGADSPIPPKHGIATAALIPGASHRIEPDCGHFPWLEHPGSVRAALDSISR